MGRLADLAAGIGVRISHLDILARPLPRAMAVGGIVEAA